MSAVRVRAVWILLAVAVPSLAGATVIVWLLQDVLGVPNPSAVYLVAVVAAAIVSGTLGAVATAVASFVLYNFLFTSPEHSALQKYPPSQLGSFISSATDTYLSFPDIGTHTKSNGGADVLLGVTPPPQMPNDCQG